MGVLLSGWLWSPSFGMGVISVIFQIRANVSVKREALIIEVIVGEMLGPLSLKTRTGSYLWIQTHLQSVYIPHQFRKKNCSDSACVLQVSKLFSDVISIFIFI